MVRYLECIDDNTDSELCQRLKNAGTIFPKKGEVYTLRAINDRLGGFLLCEIVNGTVQWRTGVSEPTFRQDRFRELLPPSELPEELTELLEGKKA